MIADKSTEMTELEVYDSIRHNLGVDFLGKDQARAALMCRIYKAPEWLAALPESLLDKLGIKYDRVFDSKDLSLAERIGARCARRILWP